MPVKSPGRGKGDAVTLADLLAGVIFAALNAYAVLGGADFGGGVWALLARGPRKERQRDLIAHAIGPVWEANHVWLILAIVLLFTGFPAAFARLGIVLHIPLSLVLIGIVLRGSAFTFWRYGGETDAEQRHWGVTFAVASLITPLLLGTTVGASASGALGEAGRGKAEGFYPGYVAPWLTPFALGVGVFALVAFAFLAAVYLTLEAEETQLREDFRRRALGAGVALFGAALLVLVLSGTGTDGTAYTLTYKYDPAKQTLSRMKVQSGATNTTDLLTSCYYFNFGMFQRNPVNGTYDQYPVANPSTCKLVQLYWICSRNILGKTANTESIESAKVVIRKE